MKDELIDKIILGLAADIDLTVTELKSRALRVIIKFGPKLTQRLKRSMCRQIKAKK